MKKLSIDWWSVILALALVALIKLNIISGVPW